MNCVGGMIDERFELIAEIGEIEEGDDVNRELNEDRSNDVKIEDTAQWTFLR